MRLSPGAQHMVQGQAASPVPSTQVSSHPRKDPARWLRTRPPLWPSACPKHAYSQAQRWASGPINGRVQNRHWTRVGMTFMVRSPPGPGRPACCPWSQEGHFTSSSAPRSVGRPFEEVTSKPGLGGSLPQRGAFLVREHPKQVCISQACVQALWALCWPWAQWCCPAGGWLFSNRAAECPKLALGAHRTRSSQSPGLWAQSRQTAGQRAAGHRKEQGPACVPRPLPPRGTLCLG